MVVIQHRHPSLILPVVRIQIATAATVSDSLFHRLVPVMRNTVNQLANDHVQLDIRFCLPFLHPTANRHVNPSAPRTASAEEHKVLCDCFVLVCCYGKFRSHYVIGADDPLR